MAAELERGRDLYVSQAWMDAYESFAAADRSDPLEAEDLELMATSAYMVGREAEYVVLLERAHGAYLGSGQPLAALRCAFWIGVTLATRGQVGHATGWLGRARRLLDREGGDRVERGYLLVPVAFEQEAEGDLGAAADTLGEAAAVGERFGDSDLFALAAHGQGHFLIRIGRMNEGLRLLDEAMVAVTAGEVSPIVSGIVYCGVILACDDAYEVRRAREWTAALTDWCERQSDLVAFTGRCLVHRAEIMQLQGAWPEALEEARRAFDRCVQGENPAAAGEACYRQGEIHRLLGDPSAAEEAYREASRLGREPQPGLALLWLAQGKADAAEAAIRRVAGRDRSSSVRRARLLPAFVEIMLAVGDVAAARGACSELESVAEGHETDALGASAAQARGAVELLDGDARGCAGLRSATHWRSGSELEATYETARVRELVGLACRALGDEDTAALELKAARATYTELTATPDLARLDSLQCARRARRRSRTHRARARGAAPSRRRATRTRRSPPSSSSASGRSTGT